MADPPKSSGVLELVAEPAGDSEPPVPASATARNAELARAPDFATGNLVAEKYLVEGELGEGGLAVVVKATHVQLEQPVAIKYLKPLALTMPGVVERFLREARLAASIKSEHAVGVHDVDTLPGGVPYMVMEYLEGRDLGQALDEVGRLPVQQAIDYILQASEALAEAHAAGIVHRDLKPGNLFVAERPGGTSMVKVLDFGISKVVGARPSSPAPSKLSEHPPESREKRLTRAGDLFGTPEFMSPEQLQGSVDLDARSDIWALGVVLYELVSGKLPFDGADVAKLSTAIHTEPPIPLRQALPEAPLELEAIVMRCLEKDPQDRYADVAELAADLAALWPRERPSRDKHIQQVIRAAGDSVLPPNPKVPTPKPPTEDSIVAVFQDASGKVLEELRFGSIDKAYEYACTLDASVVRCDVFDEFAEARGKRRATYVRQGETGHWMPLWH